MHDRTTMRDRPRRRALAARGLSATVVVLGTAVALGIGFRGVPLPDVARAVPAPAVVSAAAPSDTATPSTEATPFVVVIDAGHQAHGNYHHEPIGPGSKKKRDKVAGGTSGIVTHAHESVIDLRVALRLRDALEAAGVTVIMVRTKERVNIPNSERAKIANAAHADLFVRIHCDGTARSIHGILMLVPADNKWTGPIHAASERAARAVLDAALASTGARDRGITPRSDLSGFNWSLVPSVLVEMGNMKNAAEDRRLSTVAYQKKLAAGIAAGVLAFLADR
jgi:N-acetylmuramoyl-L-alanine amidase